MHRFKEIVLASLNLLPVRDRLIMFSIGLIQLALALLDLVGVLLIGVITTLSLYGINSRQYPEGIQRLIANLGLDGLSFQNQVALLGSITALTLLGKTMMSTLVSRRVLFFLNLRSAKVTSDILEKVLNQSFDFVKGRSPTELMYLMTRGAGALLTGVLGSINILVSEIALLSIMFIGLLFVDSTITIVALIYYGVFAALVSKRLNTRAEKLKNESISALIESESQIIQALNMYRELHVRNSRRIYSKNFEAVRYKMAELQSRNQFLPYVAKFNIEILLVLGASLLTASQFLLKDAVSAIATLSVFLAASLRVSPAILRLQQGVLSFRSSLGESGRTLSLLDELSKSAAKADNRIQTSPYATASNLGIEFKEVSFSYRGSDVEAVTQVTFELKRNQSLALVGPSGHGKSTILDLALGALKPQTGCVSIDGMSPKEFISKNPLAIGYVPQESSFFNGTIRQNLLLGVSDMDYSDDYLYRILQKVGLLDLVEVSKTGLDTNVGDRGLKFSVGQRQRLNIARALVTDPHFLLMDEPTSSLDIQSESVIAELLESLQGQKTFLVIAHRLRTIKFFDQVAIVRDGRIMALDSYDALKDEIEGLKT